jgi:hypothetical protein
MLSIANFYRNLFISLSNTFNNFSLTNFVRKHNCELSVYYFYLAFCELGQNPGAEPKGSSRNYLQPVQEHKVGCTDKKENKIFLIYKEIHIAKSYTCITNGLFICIWLNICAFPHILGTLFLYMTLHGSILNFLIYEGNLFYFLSVPQLIDYILNRFERINIFILQT